MLWQASLCLFEFAMTHNCVRFLKSLEFDIMFELATVKLHLGMVAAAKAEGAYVVLSPKDGPRGRHGIMKFGLLQVSHYCSASHSQKELHTPNNYPCASSESEFPIQ